MAKGLSEAQAQLQLYAKQAGCKSAPEEPTDKAGMFPFAVTYPATGTFQPDDATADRDIHTLFSEVHLSRNLLGRSVDKATALLKDYGLLLKQNPTLNSTVDTIVYPIRYTFGRMAWADSENIGFRLEIDVKVRNSL